MIGGECIILFIFFKIVHKKLLQNTHPTESKQLLLQYSKTNGSGQLQRGVNKGESNKHRGIKYNLN